MSLPPLNSQGELPPGVHRATIDEVVARFGGETPQRQAVTARLRRIHTTALATGRLDSMIIFGSFVTTKSAPNDVDIVLVMHDDFDLLACVEEARGLFDHERAEREFGASVFWIRPSLLILETLEEFVAHWQIKRDRTRRGIVEVQT